jgi:ABC-type nickel/cobalt efflux system permease component RcnA
VDPFLLYLTALALGAVHTFEVDHLAAVSAFVALRPRPREALGYGVRWAVGHGGIILVVGTGLVLVRGALTEDTGVLLERAVGASLIVLGLWVMANARRLHAHRHAHDDGTRHTHLHVHGPARARHGGDGSPLHRHRHTATALGALHGLAGTAPALALLPVARIETPAGAVAYLLLFGLGTALAMGLYAMLAGVVAGRAAARSEALGRGLARIAGVGTVLVGVVWLLGWA